MISQIRSTLTLTLVLSFGLGLAFGTAAQDQQPAAQQQPSGQQAQARRPGQTEAPPRPENTRLPADSVTHHSIDARGTTLRYTVTAGSIPLMDGQNRVLVEIGYVAYVLDGGEPSSRPITFAFNGGPGASSAYLHFGSLGPKRLAFGNQDDTPSKPPVLTDNPDTWLDFTDVVFVDPVGTGYSRFITDNENTRRQFWSVDGDAQGLARIVAKYLQKNGRITSPKYLVGESYGGFRAPKIATQLSSGEGIAVNGLVLVSPALDFTLRSDSAVSVLSIAARLPSMAAAKLERDGTLSAERLAEVEGYARTDFVLDLLRGPRDRAAVDRIVDKVSAYTGLDPAFVRRHGGRIDMWSFSREFHRASQRIGSSYDVSVTGLDPTPGATQSQAEDAVLDASRAPLTSAAVDYLGRSLNWRVEGRYNLLNGEVSRGWRWSAGPNAAQTFSDLRRVLAADQKVKVLVVHGFTDLVTPYFAAQLLLDQLPAFGEQSRIRLDVFPGGHMFYTRDGSRAAFRESVKKLVDAAAG
jgi:carboxypeptidase C (cathepsin A)